MNYSYKKMYNKNYLILDHFDIPIVTDDYRLEMLKRNTIDGLLDMQLFMEDNLPYFHYDITCRQAFHSYFYDNKIRKSQLIAFFSNLHRLLINLNKYLLDYNHLVFTPQCIFFNKELDSFYFTYCPNYEKDFFAELKEFIAYLLSIADHDDEPTVLLSYALWQETQDINFNLKSLLSVIEKYSDTESLTTNTPLIPSDISTPTVENTTNQPDTNILKEPDVLLKENYIYTPEFILKNSAVLIAMTIILIGNIICKLLSVYSTELFFIILIAIICSCIFFISSVLREAPLHRIYDKTPPEEVKNIIQINTCIETPSNDETVLLCVNPALTTHRLIYTGIDFSQDVEIKEFPFTIGKSDSNSMIINNPAVSRSHGRIIMENNSFYIEDLNSSNGTSINGSPIASYTLTEITGGDKISFADLTYIFQ